MAVARKHQASPGAVQVSDAAGRNTARHLHLIALAMHEEPAVGHVLARPRRRVPFGMRDGWRDGGIGGKVVGSDGGEAQVQTSPMNSPARLRSTRNASGWRASQ